MFSCGSTQNAVPPVPAQLYSPMLLGAEFVPASVRTANPTPD